MSWVVEEWKEGLSRRALQKIQELESQLDKLKKERQQRQLQHELLEAALQKQKREMVEQKMERLLNCQREFLESYRRSLEQKIKEKEKEVFRQLHSLLAVDHQDLEQVKNDYNGLWAELDKAIVVKQHLENYSSELTQKLCRAETALRANQSKENDLRGNFEEMKEKTLLCCQSDQKSQKIHQLEEELKTTKHFLKETQNYAEEMKNKSLSQDIELETQQAEIRDLKSNNKLLQDSVKQLQLVFDTWNLEKNDVSTMLSLYEKEIEDLTEENGTLKDINKALEQEKVDLLEKNIIFSNNLKEREESISELSRRHKEERLSLIERYEEIEKELVDLQGKYKSMEEKNANTEGILRQQKSHFQESKAESERQEKQHRDERHEFFSKLVSLEGKNKDLIQELEKVQSELQFKQAEIAHIQNVSSAELDCLRQEMLHVRAEQNKMQEQQNILLQENEQLSKVIKTKNESPACYLVHDRRPTSEQLGESMEEKENELNEYQVKLELLQMDLEDREVSVENCSTQLDNLKPIVQQKKQNGFACSKMKMWMKSCKQLEKEKEMLQKQIAEHSALLKKQKPSADEVPIYLHSLTHENEPEYEPDGLPEVVKKGFADIPTGKTNPYVLRKTTLHLRTSLCLAAQSQKLTPCAQHLQKGRSHNPAEISKLTAGGSKSQKVDETQQCQAETAIEPMESSSRSPLCINKQPTKAVPENSRENLNKHKGRCSLSTQTLPDQNEQDKNCMVQ